MSDLYRVDHFLHDRGLMNLPEWLVPVEAERVVLCAECDLMLGGLGECPRHGDNPIRRVVLQVEVTDDGSREA